jgi:bifunctional DNA-binding transcriptional regulator/antitoxin component of YhaV-PrlF toxin-antitoxin module
MRSTIDKVGRLVVPKPLRDSVGMTAGEVEITVSGTGLLIEPVANDEIGDEEGRPVIPASGTSIDDAAVRALKDAGQR